MDPLELYSIKDILKKTNGSTWEKSPLVLDVVTGSDNLLSNAFRINFSGISIVLSGSVTFSVNLKTYSATTGYVLSCTKGNIYSFKDTSPDLRVKIILFDESFVSEINEYSRSVIKVPFLHISYYPIVKLATRELDRILTIIDLIENSFLNDQRKNWPAIKNLLLAVLYDISEIYKDEKHQYSLYKDSKSLDLVNKYLELVSEQYLTERNISTYAERLSISSKHLSETVKKITGRPAYSWIEQMILQEAQVLLKQSSLTVSEIGHRLDFFDRSAFGKFFRKKMGVTPAQYRDNP
ncbi:hypothetical protein DSL64_15630 [Dyadobacter luteus]|uniref:HTH araC/xylS-type domain-containing protein n=1 Tax=Dyadobacter luteus TaxID=2259619 RepID=A0A3D8Y9F9_9BACT|nr:helix-turn-helix transcriptional regulator [Dyadobacter luteus]REA60106.1 hypothetical protein DSL64_15630 [Dyadobacter luteus]